MIPEPRFLIVQNVSIHEPQMFDSYYGGLRGTKSFAAEYNITIRESNYEKATEIIEKIRQGKSIVDAMVYDLKQKKLVSEKEYLLTNQEQMNDRENNDNENWSWSIGHPQINCGNYENVFTVRYRLNVDFNDKTELLNLIDLYMDKRLFQAVPQGEKAQEGLLSDIEVLPEVDLDVFNDLFQDI